MIMGQTAVLFGICCLGDFVELILSCLGFLSIQSPFGRNMFGTLFPPSGPLVIELKAADFGPPRTD